MKIRVIVSVFLVMMAFCCPADSEKGFSWNMSIWVERISWTARIGFALDFRSWNKPPILGEQRANEREPRYVAVEKGIRLLPGVRYELTNGRGRLQVMQVLTSAPAKDLPPLDWTRGVLSFEHQERINRNGDLRIERFLLSSKGEVYDFQKKAVSRVGMPLVLSDPWPPPQVRAERSVIESAYSNLQLSRDTLASAKKSLSSPEMLSRFAADETNEVCYYETKRFDAETVRKMTKDGRLSPFLADLVAQAKPSPASSRKIAKACVRGGEVQIIEIREMFSSGNTRRTRYSAAGAVDFSVQFTKSQDLRLFYHYDESGRFRWVIRCHGNDVEMFWRSDDGRTAVRETDSGLARRLIESLP